jgi:hypothetical protein
MGLYVRIQIRNRIIIIIIICSSSSSSSSSSGSDDGGGAGGGGGGIVLAISPGALEVSGRALCVLLLSGVPSGGFCNMACHWLGQGD